ncbi:hypothetical protein GN244_ATG05124 [Phytophthora infestans]|uniref:Uncharacterized protein n=1 Tax=Phytophthora infestans TaxID=4787 RepID=A0A833WMX0_PHYIN|nr:hypothetical protein GN244_ATG05124 [Phytophthora infestans]KAF4139089.1 hypothetical protein GN958_ATG11751 [Phytophthora infestans]
MSSSPAVKYARYKRATAFFLDWLLRARGGGRHAGQRVQLEALNDVVKEIAADPSTLTPKLLQQLPKALAACQYAITLREHVASFFSEDKVGALVHGTGRTVGRCIQGIQWSETGEAVIGGGNGSSEAGYGHSQRTDSETPATVPVAPVGIRHVQ